MKTDLSKDFASGIAHVYSIQDKDPPDIIFEASRAGDKSDLINELQTILFAELVRLSSNDFGLYESAVNDHRDMGSRILKTFLEENFPILKNLLDNPRPGLYTWQKAVNDEVQNSLQG